MSVHQPALEALGDHDYLVRFAQDEDTASCGCTPTLPWLP